MIGKVKKWLGIEGVKLEVRVPDGQQLSDGRISGTLHFQSLQEQTVTGVQIVLIEKYSRGRGEERLIDEYELGRLRLNETFTVTPEEEIVKPFSLAFEPLRSAVDEWGDRNLVNRNLAKMARWVRQADSIYRIEAEAKVEGVALNPYAKKTIELS